MLEHATDSISLAKFIYTFVRVSQLYGAHANPLGDAERTNERRIIARQAFTAE
jgi:hypothetical protein